MSIAPGQNAITGMPPAGWYADPSGGGQRWWDGAQWTSHVMPTDAPLSPAPAPASAQATVSAGGAWTPGPTNPLGQDPYAELGATASTAQQRSPGGYLPTAASGGHGTSPAYGGVVGYEANGTVSGAAFPYSYLPGVAAPKNTRATIGFVLGVVFVSIGVLFGYWFGSLIAVVVSITGLTRSRKLAAQGYPAVGRSLAIWGIVLSALSWAVAVGLRFAGFGL